ncbi:acyltransferase [bacterium]|nr:acyltransferase [bacterium]
MEKLKNIEFIRVFLITAIVFLHMFINRVCNLCHIYPDISIYQTIKSAIAHSNNSVEGFFIVAGFFLVYTFKSHLSLKNFILKKYIRLSPAILFSMGLCAIGWLLGAMHIKLIPNLLTVFLLNHFGINIAVGQNPILWYTSTLFAGLLLYFCIIKYLPVKIKYWTIAILAISGYIILEILQHGSFANPLVNYHHVFNIGFLRTVGGIGLGCLIGYLYKNVLSKYNQPLKNMWLKWFFTLLEVGFMAFVVWWCMCIHKSINNIVIVLCFGILLILFLFKKGYLSQITDSDIWVKLGRYQYSIYVVHYVIIRILGLKVWKHCPNFVAVHPILPIIINLIVILLVGILTYHMVELPCAKFLTNKLIRKEN